MLLLDALSNLRLRRLQLAAETGLTWGVVFRPAQRASQPSPAPLRLEIEALAEPLPGAPGRLPGVRVKLRKARGARTGLHCQLQL